MNPLEARTAAIEALMDVAANCDVPEDRIRAAELLLRHTLDTPEASEIVWDEYLDD